jgi:D-methionine transport system substrate-binding protein
MKFCIGPLVSAVWLLAAPLAGAETVKVGVLPNVYAQSIEALIPEAKGQGLDIQIVEFSDWTTPNLALQSGDIDVNYFQHKPFLTTRQSRRATTLASRVSACSPTSGSIR